MSSKNIDNEDSSLLMYLCNKLNKSKNTLQQLRKYAKEVGISTQGKNRGQLCKELSKKYDENLKMEEEEIKSDNVQKINIDQLSVKLAKLIDNYEGGFRNYFEPQDIINWNKWKEPYDYHEVLYKVKRLNVIKENESKLEKLFNFDRFPNFGELLSLLIYSIENIPIDNLQTYVISLKEIFMANSQSEKEDEEKLFEYDYENEYGIRR